MAEVDKRIKDAEKEKVDVLELSG